MAPLITLVVVTALARAAGWRGLGGDRFAHRAGALRAGVAAMFVLTGAAHFVGLREDLMRMVPPVFGDPGLWVTLTGIAEIAGAAGILLSATRRPAAAGLVLLLLAVFPANIHAALHEIPFGGEPATPLLPRLLEQLFYLACVAWAGFGPTHDRVGAPAGLDAPLPAVSTTALWVARHRALESSRPDALFRDPLALELAARATGELPKGLQPWAMIVRTQLVDELVLEAVAAGADCVLDLAAGMDARPYRLPLPRELVWVEADLPACVDAKEALVVGHEPRCEVRRERVDLADPAARAAFLDRALAGARRAVVVTEGLLLYLDDATVEAIARELQARAEVDAWILDLASPALLRRLQKVTDASLGAARMRFGPPNGVAFFRPFGWAPRTVHSIVRQGRRLRRLPLFFHLISYLPQADPARPADRPWGGVAHFVRA